MLYDAAKTRANRNSAWRENSPSHKRSRDTSPKTMAALANHKRAVAAHARRIRMLLVCICLCGLLMRATSPLSGEIDADTTIDFSMSSEPSEFIFRDAQLPSPSAPSSTEATTEPQIPAVLAYENETTKIEITRYESLGSVYYTAEIWLSDITQLRSAFSNDTFDSVTETVRDIAERQNAILAFNGDFATFNNGGIIIRNGELFRSNKSTRHLLLIDQNGDFHTMVDPPEDAKEAAAQYIVDGMWHTCVFGPVLVENWQATELPKDFFISTKATHEPRTAIAQLGPLHYMVIIVDGRQDGYSKGVSLTRLQEICIEHGAITAFNLDGGGSTTLYFDGEIINSPANGSMRRVPDIFYIAR